MEHKDKNRRVNSPLEHYLNTETKATLEPKLCGKLYDTLFELVNRQLNSKNLFY